MRTVEGSGELRDGRMDCDRELAPQVVERGSKERLLTTALQTFANFVNGTISFTYPPTAGWSFSFTNTGYFEQSQCQCTSSLASVSTLTSDRRRR